MRALESDLPRWARVGIAVAAAALLAAALAAKPLAGGDALEYLLQTESLARHATPEARANDVWALARQDARLALGLNYALGYRGYFDDPSGKWFASHFWAYSLLAVPARLLLGLLGLSGLRAFSATNAALFALALHQLLLRLPFRARWRAVLAVMLLTGPVICFVRWPHAEALTVATTALALTMRYAGHPAAAVAWASLASLQSPPFVILVACLWLDGVVRHRDARWRTTLAASFCLLAPAFYLWRFGTPSLIAREAASVSRLSLRRAAELFVDPNIGLVRAMPVSVALFATAAGWALLRARARPFEAALVVAIAAMALACTATGNWNHGTIGPSRYGVWLTACIAFVIVAAADATAGRVQRVVFGAALAAVAAQALLLLANGGPLARPDDLRHSAAARLTLRYAPSAYQPDPAVFAARTLGRPTPPPGLVVYQDGGKCRKALARAGDGPELLARCGSIPAPSRAFFGSDDPLPRYVDY